MAWFFISELILYGHASSGNKHQRKFIARDDICMINLINSLV